MLKGHFENCYGLEYFDLLPIPFSAQKNKAIIYAPNGVMKSSFAGVFDNISRRKKTEDRIFTERTSSYSVEYYDATYTERHRRTVPTFYVINSFNAAFESYNDSVATIVADEELKVQYASVIETFSEKMLPFTNSLQRHCSSNLDIESAVAKSFACTPDDDWDVVIKAMALFAEGETPNNALATVRYDEIFNAQVLKVISRQDFLEKVKQYIAVIDVLLQGSKLFNTSFDDTSAKEFGNTIAKTHLFDANHRLLLQDGTIISSMDEWQILIDSEMERIHQDETAQSIYNEINTLLGANAATRKLREIIKANRMLLAHFENLELLEKRLWLSYLCDDDISIKELHEAVQQKNADLVVLNDRAVRQLAHWRHVIDVFTTRFRAPFSVSIDNETKVVLKGEPARLVFTYNRNGESRAKSKEDLMNCLSVGEKRALYLLQILFDLEKIKASTESTGKKHLVIADDIADSFDYTNKYAIIEYLDELASNQLIDLLVLTHNFDFYRTVSSRLDIKYDMCFAVQKKNTGELSMEAFTYKNDYFTKGILDRIRNGQIGSDIVKQKMVIASIPFCRNVVEYLGNEDAFQSLTALLHIKPSTETTTLCAYWDTIKGIFNLGDLDCDEYASAPVVSMIFNLADILVASGENTVSLEDKLVMSIAIRLKSEMFLRQILIEKDIELECKKNQLRTWMKRAKDYIDQDKYDILNAVGLITPESIHVNAFMYEPLIDIPNWKLYDLYRKVCSELTILA